MKCSIGRSGLQGDIRRILPQGLLRGTLLPLRKPENPGIGVFRMIFFEVTDIVTRQRCSLQNHSALIPFSVQHPFQKTQRSIGQKRVDLTYRSGSGQCGRQNDFHKGRKPDLRCGCIHPSGGVRKRTYRQWYGAPIIIRLRFTRNYSAKKSHGSPWVVLRQVSGLFIRQLDRNQ